MEFAEADLSNAVFSHCNLSRVIFDRTLLVGTDFRTVVHFSIDPEQNFIQKAKFSMQNIAGLLERYKIVIE